MYPASPKSNDPVGLYGGDHLSVSFSRVKYLALYAKISIVMQIIEMGIVADHITFCRRQKGPVAQLVRAPDS